jgi:competence protein ComEA
MGGPLMVARVETVLLVLIASVAIAQNGTAQDQLPKGPGRETVEVVCGSCHDIGTTTGAHRTNSDWMRIVDAMINRGALGTDDEFKAVIRYLSKYFGLVNVNKATAKELEEVLEIPTSAAEGIVRHRTEHGPFETLESVKSVPGIDAGSIEERKARIAFK